MNIIDQIRNRVEKYLARRKFYHLGTERWTAENFANVRKALSDCIDLYLADKIPYPNHGICFSAGFMSLGRDAPYKQECSLFLYLAHMFNTDTRQLTGKNSHCYPFTDVDAFGYFLWKGPSAEVRLRCMSWIIEQIDSYRLDNGMVIPDTIWITVPDLD